MSKQPTTNELLIRLDERTSELLRRMDNIDENFVPKNEVNQALKELRDKHESNQENIEKVQASTQEQITSLEVRFRELAIKLGTGLGTLQVVTAIAIYLITKG